MKTLSKNAFTLAEMLITLVVIGIVAAITVPMLHNSTNDKQYNVARQKAKATIGEAFKLMTINGEIDKDKSTKEFAEEVLPKYLKIAKKCGLSDTAKNLTDCGFSSDVKLVDDTHINFLNTVDTLQHIGIPRMWVANATAPDDWANLQSKLADYNYTNYNTSYALQTLDGFSLAFFYNPYCATSTEDKITFYSANGSKTQMTMDIVCFNSVYDMNGKKGPNQVGKDIGFVGSFYNSYMTSAEAVLPHKEKYRTTATNKFEEAQNFCANLDSDNNWVLPNKGELNLLNINLNLVSKDFGGWYWSRSLQSETQQCIWAILFTNSGSNGFNICNPVDTTEPNIFARCVRNNALK